VVELVLPGGFRGAIKAEIRVRPDVPCAPGQRTFRYDVPQTGIVQVNGPPVFGQGLIGPEIVAKFADGTTVPSEKDAKPGDTALRWIRRASGDVYLVVGTNGEADVVRRSLSHMGELSDAGSSASANDRPSGRGGRHGGGMGGRGGMRR
jgi:hypothetical protein